MNGIDKLLRARIEEWLAQKKYTAADLLTGATYMLQCNRNRAMYNTVTRKPEHYKDKIVYELKKHLAYLSDDMTLKEVRTLETKVLPIVEKAINETEKTAEDGVEVAEGNILPSPAVGTDGVQTENVIARGKRADHDTLPEAIRLLWDKNADRYKTMKQAHETCKTLTAACDRYEFVKALAELWESYKKDFDTYDHYVLVDVNDEAGTQSPADDAEKVELSAQDIKDVNAARSYISKNLPKLLELVKASKGKDFTEKQAESLENWREKIQQRADVLVRTKQVMTEELKAQLTEAGISLDTTDSDEQGQEHSDDTPATE